MSICFCRGRGRKPPAEAESFLGVTTFMHALCMVLCIFVSSNPCMYVHFIFICAYYYLYVCKQKSMSRSVSMPVCVYPYIYIYISILIDIRFFNAYLLVDLYLCGIALILISIFLFISICLYFCDCLFVGVYYQKGILNLHRCLCLNTCLIEFAVGCCIESLKEYVV